MLTGPKSSSGCVYWFRRQLKYFFVSRICATHFATMLFAVPGGP